MQFVYTSLLSPAQHSIFATRSSAKSAVFVDPAEPSWSYMTTASQPSEKSAF